MAKPLSCRSKISAEFILQKSSRFQNQRFKKFSLRKIRRSITLISAQQSKMRTFVEEYFECTDPYQKVKKAGDEQVCLSLSTTNFRACMRKRKKNCLFSS